MHPTPITPPSARWLLAMGFVTLLAACAQQPKVVEPVVVPPPPAPVVEAPPAPAPVAPVMSEDLRALLKELKVTMASKGVEVSETPDLAIKVVVPSDHAFDRGQHGVRPGLGRLLTKLAEGLNHHIATKVEILGYTDSVGGDGVNFPLSYRRAGAARDHLVKNGVLADRISAVGWGPDHPVADNKTAEGRAKNRRVEFIITAR